MEGGGEGKDCGKLSDDFMLTSGPRSKSLSCTFPSEKGRSSVPSPIDRFDLFGWKPNPNLSDDENYMDLVFLITRSGRSDKGYQGHMGSLIVQPSKVAIGSENANEKAPSELAEDHAYRIRSNILGAATNIPLFGTKEVTSDIHAEISALGQAGQAGLSTKGATAYITIPPCKRCFAALVAFGVGRIVTRQEAPRLIRETAARTSSLGLSGDDGNEVIRVEHFTRDQNRRQMQRINQLVNPPDRTDEELMRIAELNRIRRQERKLAKKNKEMNDINHPKS